jgi:tetratricopeptide (TPR) repeat protein
MDRQVGGAGNALARGTDPWPEVEVTAARVMEFRKRDDVEGARRLFHQAVESNGRVPARAAFELGQLFAEHQDWTDARDAYQMTADLAADRTLAVRADFLAALARSALGDQAGAEAAYRRVIASGDKDYAPRAAFNLERALAGRGEIHAARAAYQQAVASGHRLAASRAGFNLGMDLARDGDRDGATAALRASVATGDPEFAPKAAFHLGAWLREWGDEAGARQPLEFAAG